MTKSELAIQVDEIQRAVDPLFKSAGFRKRGRTYNRVSADGLVHVVNFQMGASDPPGTTYFAGLRENLYGLFTVNLGVYIPEVARHHGGGEPKSLVQEYHCSLRTRLGDLTGERHDVWWPATADSTVVQDVTRRLDENALPFFDRLADRNAVLNNWPDIEASIGRAASRSWRIVAAIVLAEKGQRVQAGELLKEQAADMHNPQHPEYVPTLARKICADWSDA